MDRWLRIAGLLVALVVFSLTAIATRSVARPSTEPAPVVLVAPVKGTVDLGLAPFVDRVLDEAERDGAAAVVLDIDTFGGRLDAAVTIRDRLLASRVKTIAFVHPRAISAGALISLASEKIAMSDGSTIGAATPVQMQPGGGAVPVDEKTVSYVRKEFHATAQQRGRPVELAEAMVDPDVDVPGVSPPGKLLTLTGTQAVELGIADVRADDVPDVLAQLGLGGAELRAIGPNWAERAVSALTQPLVSSLLMTLGIVGLLVELRTPGFGAPGIVGVVCLALFFGAHWIVRLAGFEELILVGIGLTLLAVEIFVTPGFGLAGILGIVALVAGLGLSLLGEGATTGAVLASLGRVAISLIFAIALGAALFFLLPRVPFARGIVLTAGLPGEVVAAPPAPTRSLVGTTGTAATPLRPAGAAWLDGERVDVVTDGEFVAPGTTIEVIRHEGSRVVVRPVSEPPHGLAEKGRTNEP
jgi:membrane-bound serine protease (ClpP class)